MRADGKCSKCGELARTTYCPACRRKYYRDRADIREDAARSASACRVAQIDHYREMKRLANSRIYHLNIEVGRARSRAYNRVYRALKRGAVVKPDICDRCRAQAEVEAHHWHGYENPLDVEWLCGRCHKNEDKPLSVLSVQE